MQTNTFGRGFGTVKLLI